MNMTTNNNNMNMNTTNMNNVIMTTKPVQGNLHLLLSSHEQQSNASSNTSGTAINGGPSDISVQLDVLGRDRSSTFGSIRDRGLTFGSEFDLGIGLGTLGGVGNGVNVGVGLGGGNNGEASSQGTSFDLGGVTTNNAQSSSSNNCYNVGQQGNVVSANSSSASATPVPAGVCVASPSPSPSDLMPSTLPMVDFSTSDSQQTALPFPAIQYINYNSSSAGNPMSSENGGANCGASHILETDNDHLGIDSAGNMDNNNNNSNSSNNDNNNNNSNFDTNLTQPLTSSYPSSQGSASGFLNGFFTNTSVGAQSDNILMGNNIQNTIFSQTPPSNVATSYETRHFGKRMRAGVSTHHHAVEIGTLLDADGLAPPYIDIFTFSR